MEGRHAKRFPNHLVMYDREGDACIIKRVYEDDGKGGDMKQVNLKFNQYESYAEDIEDSLYFQELPDR